MKNATVAIIGGGFSGTVAAIRLLSSPQRGGPTLPFGSKIVLIEPGRAGEGLAYRAGPENWRLNVPAGKMSAFPERPDDFLTFARGRNPLVSGGDFLPRSWYGDYLSDRLELAKRRSPRWLSFERARVRATAIDVARSSARISLEDGTVIEADRVLLALGNSPAAGPLAGAADVVNDAWNLRWMERLPTYVPRVLLVGTGLTMIDIALAIAERRRDVRMTAISRHGLLPQPHEEDAAHGAASKFDATALARPRAAVRAPAPLPRAGRGLRRRLARGAAAGARGHARALARRAETPAAALPASPARALGRASPSRAGGDPETHRDAAREKAARHSRRPHRRDAAHQGRHRRRLAAARQRRDPRGAVRRRRQRHRTGRRSEALVAAPSCSRSWTRGSASRTASDSAGARTRTGACSTRTATPSEVLFYAGPLLRARHWEATAVPELRVHVARTASAIAASLATGAGSYIRRIATPIFRREQQAY